MSEIHNATDQASHGGSGDLNDPEPSTALTTRVLLLRHAETAAPDCYHGAESDIGLGPRGRRQSARVARVIAARTPDAIYSSAMRRARETAAAIAAVCRRELQIIPELHERRMGRLSGALRADGWPTYDQTKSRWALGDLDATHEGAESFAAIRDRVVPALTGLVPENRGRTVVVVAHGVVIRVLLTTLLEGFGPGDFDRIGIGFTAIHDLVCEGSRWRALGLDHRRSDHFDDRPNR